MKTLILIRHAKSDYPFGLDDHQRPLAPRGRSDAPRVAVKAAHLVTDGARYCSSTARRALETARIFGENWGIPPSVIDFTDDLYTFDHGKLHDFVSNLPDDVEKVFIFGHNEAITDFVNKFGNIYIDNVPTCGLVELLLPTDSWRQLVRGSTGTVIFPKDLKHGQPDL